jgi:predicted DCC family thiol-disulfide oxidoreductase YuxK
MAADDRWPARVYYDGTCRLCMATVDRLTRADTERRLRLIDFTSGGFDARGEGLNEAALRDAMHVKLADGTVSTGADAMLVVADALPSWWALRALGGVPGMRMLARPIYRWVARNRYALAGRCAHDGCVVNSKQD